MKARRKDKGSDASDAVISGTGTDDASSTKKRVTRHKNQKKGANKGNRGSWIFLGLVGLGYLVLLGISAEMFMKSVQQAIDIIVRILPVFLVVLVLMALSNHLITKDFVVKHLKEKGIRKWLFVIAGGILSAGPIYMWYPLLGDLNKKGLSYGLVSCFLYNRAIKIPLLPVAIYYFGLAYMIILGAVMVAASVFQGLFIDWILDGGERHGSDQQDSR